MPILNIILCLSSLAATPADLKGVERALAAAQFRSAESLLDAVPAELHHAPWHILMSRAFDGMNLVSKAVEEAQSAVNLEPRNEATHLQLAQIFLSRNTPEAAWEILRAAKPVFPESPMIHLGLGLALNGMQRYAEAAEELKICLDMRPDFGTAFDALGTVYVNANSYDELLPAASKYSEKNPGDYRGWCYLAVAKQRLGGNEEEIIPILQRGLELNPKYAQGHALMGKILLDSGALKGAVVELELAVQLRPSYAPAHLYLGTAYSRMGRKQDAAHEAAALARLNQEQNKPAPRLSYHRGPAHQ